MQRHQVPSAEYSSYINHVISLGLAGDYIAQLHGNRSCCSCGGAASNQQSHAKIGAMAQDCLVLSRYAASSAGRIHLEFYMQGEIWF